MIKERGSLVEMMVLWLPLEWAGSRYRLYRSPQLELWALMAQECHAEVVAGVPDVAEFDEG